MPYVQSITDVLSAHLGWHRARLKFMARFTAALLKMTTTNLREIATALKAGVKEESNYRRIRRFLSSYEMDLAVLGRFLARLLPQSAPYKVVIDRTEWHFGTQPVNVLMVGIAHKGVAFPISWAVLPDGGSTSASEHCRALRRFFQVVEPSEIEAVIADREKVISPPSGSVGSRPGRFLLWFVFARIGTSFLQRGPHCRPGCLLARLLFGR